MSTPRPSESVMTLPRADGTPGHLPPSRRALTVAGVVALAGSLALDALLVVAGTGLFPSIRHFSHFAWWDYGSLTALGVILATLAWPYTVRVASSPRAFFLRLAVVATLVLFLPDLWLLLVSHAPGRAVAVLVAMHLGVAVVTYNCLVRLAPAADGTEGEATAAETVPAEPTGEEPAPARSPARLATSLLVLVGIEFVLGVSALFAVPAGRPSGWLPRRGTDLYLAHAVVGLPLALGALALVPLAAGATRSLRVTAWIGLAGVAAAGAGGMLTASHPLRILGMALMFLGPLVAGFAYLIPVLDRLPREEPPYPG